MNRRLKLSKKASAVFLGIFFILAAFLHLFEIEMLSPYMPSYITEPAGFLYAAIAAAFAGGILISIPYSRKTGAAWLSIFLLLLLPVNIEILTSGLQGVSDTALSAWIIMRTGFQFAVIYWILWSAEIITFTQGHNAASPVKVKPNK